MTNAPRDPVLADAFRSIVAGYDPLERVRLDQAETLAALSDYGALLALKWRLNLPSTASLAEVGDSTCLLSDSAEREWAEALWMRCAVRFLAWRRSK